MTGQLIPTDIDQSVALDWLRHSLTQGEVQVIASVVRKVIEEREGRAYALASQEVDPSRLATPCWGGAVKPGSGSAREALGKVFETLAKRGASCVVVEDEMRLRRHPKPSVDGLLLTGFVGEMVIHWANLADNPRDAVLAVHRGSGDYPTNAFVTSALAEELGLVDGAELNSGIGDAVAASLVAVVVAAYDAETYIIWEPLLSPHVE